MEVLAIVLNNSRVFLLHIFENTDNCFENDDLSDDLENLESTANTHFLTSKISGQNYIFILNFRKVMNNKYRLGSA